jgi:N-acetylglutamate synthase-like GNAT family acetyltransferase
MPLSFTIRPAHRGQAEEISALIGLYVPSGTLLPRTPEFLAEQAEHILVAVAGGRVVGCVHLEEYAPSLAEIRSVAVSPAAQGAGVGAALVQAAEALARQRDIGLVFAVSNNDAFFRGQGYEPREIPELNRERSAVSRFKGVYAKELAPRESVPRPRRVQAPAG